MWLSGGFRYLSGFHSQEAGFLRLALAGSRLFVPAIVARVSSSPSSGLTISHKCVVGINQTEVCEYEAGKILFLC